MRKTKLSTCRRKAAFDDAQAALRFAASAGHRQAPYRCNQCGAWHLSSRLKGKWPIPATAVSAGGE